MCIYIYTCVYVYFMSLYKTLVQEITFTILYRVHSDTFRYTFGYLLIPSVIFCLHFTSQNGTVISYLTMEH